MPLASVPAPQPAAELPTSRVRTERLTAARLHAFEWLVLLAVASFIGFRVLPRAWNHLNTDFPNYYVTARLLREGYSTRRIYEWIWLQRQKDRMGILPSEQPVVGFVPHTPFSALLLWPLTYGPPLAAKRIWILCNLLLLIAVAVFLRSLTQLAWRRLALLIGLCYPVVRNFEYGQYYIVILVLLTGALYLYVRDRRFPSGVLVGIAAGLKIFPALFVFYFLRKRDFRAVFGLATGALATVAASAWAFGLEVHHTYLSQVLPWAMRGDAMDPYALSPNSISALLHKLFIFEPQWNPYPALHAPLIYAILHPLLQLLVLAPCVYLSSPSNRDDIRLQLEWSAFLLALLTISTMPASYHFTLLILPVAILTSQLLREQNYALLAATLILYLGIGFPAWPHLASDSWGALLAVPRLYLLLLLCAVFYLSLSRGSTETGSFRVDRKIWVAAFAALFVVQLVATLHHQRGLYDRYNERISLPPEILSASAPAVHSDSIDFIAMGTEGYKLGIARYDGVHLTTSTSDQLSHTATREATWIEEARTQSNIVRVSEGGQQSTEVTNAEHPAASPDGLWLAYLRSSKGKDSLWLRSLSIQSRPDVQVTSPDFDVEEMTFLPDGSLIFAAQKAGRDSELYQVNPGEAVRPLHISRARYPAASLDGQWLAYSLLDRGIWNLWLQNLRTGEKRRITSAECNDITPTWQPDSKTLIYATDCGRALWFTALNRERVLP